MAMTIFMILNGMGVAFLLYVLGHFWIEGRQSSVAAPRRRVVEFSNGRSADVLVITHPITQSGQGGLSVISIKSTVRIQKNKHINPDAADRIVEMPMRQFSTR
jgi:hypothetical protein